jgi:hypothetical protein
MRFHKSASFRANGTRSRRFPSPPQFYSSCLFFSLFFPPMLFHDPYHHFLPLSCCCYSLCLQHLSNQILLLNTFFTQKQQSWKRNSILLHWPYNYTCFPAAILMDVARKIMDHVTMLFRTKWISESRLGKQVRRRAVEGEEIQGAVYGRFVQMQRSVGLLD